MVVHGRQTYHFKVTISFFLDLIEVTVCQLTVRFPPTARPHRPGAAGTAGTRPDPRLRGLRIAKIPTSAAARQPAGQAEGSISDYRRSGPRRQYSAGATFVPAGYASVSLSRNTGTM